MAKCYLFKDSGDLEEEEEEEESSSEQTHTQIINKDIRCVSIEGVQTYLKIQRTIGVNKQMFIFQGD